MLKVYFHMPLFRQLIRLISYNHLKDAVMSTPKQASLNRLIKETKGILHSTENTSLS